ncbi:MAG: hypothetical protein VYB65_01455 [Myxococcota bacterium]|nr:hypothetical protein [Myxococcota bacterium]
MNTKNILTLMGVVVGLQGIGIFAGAEPITTEAFAALKPDAVGIQIGAMLHEAMGVMMLMVGIILLFARSLEPAAGARVLMGASIGITLTVGQGFYHMFTTVVAPPLPVLLLTSAMAVLGFVTAAKAKGSAEAAE